MLVVPDPLHDADPRVRAAAIRTVLRGDVERWQRVADDADAQVRIAAAKDGWFAPMAVWRRLAQDGEVKVRRAVVRSRWVHPEVLRLMTGDADASIAGEATARVLA